MSRIIVNKNLDITTSGRRSKKAGFTLVEVVAAVGIGLIVVVSAVVVMPSGAFLTQDNRYQLYSINAIREELENMRDMDYDDIVAYGASSTFTNAQITKLPSGVATRAIADAFDSNIKKVTLTVSWRSLAGKTKQAKTSTYITRIGINGS